MSFIINSAKF